MIANTRAIPGTSACLYGVYTDWQNANLRPVLGGDRAVGTKRHGHSASSRSWSLQRVIHMTLRSLIRLSLLVCSVVPTVIAQAQSSPEQSSTNQRHEERIRDLEAENSRLQQEVIRLRNATLQHQASLRPSSLRDSILADVSESRMPSLPTPLLTHTKQRRGVLIGALPA